MNIPADKNKNWVAGLHKGIDQLDTKLKAAVMKQGGADCAVELLGRCADHLGRPVKTVEDLVNGWNNLRNSRGLNGRWQFENRGVRGIFAECGCPLVRSGLVDLHPVQCLCSQGMMETIFSSVAGKAVRVKIIRAVGRGDTVCEFVVAL